MPLKDHFRPPLSSRRHWHAFHNAWATYLAAHLNHQLPEGYFAEANVQFDIQIDVAAFEETAPALAGIPLSENGAGQAAPLVGPWQGPAPTQTVPFSLSTDIVEVLVFDREGGPTLAGAIELVSPANKDRPASRDAFVCKCAAYLQQGVGLVVADVVTGRRANLHDELLARLGPQTAVRLGSELYAAAYRPVSKAGQPELVIWQQPLELGQPLPMMPLWLRGNVSLRADLEATYEQTCREYRIETGAG